MVDMKKGARITGASRDKLANQLTKRYEGGASIRDLAASTGRSYGFVHRILSESGASMRGRGGATRGKDGKATGARTASGLRTAKSVSSTRSASPSKMGRTSRKSTSRSSSTGRAKLRSVT